MRSNAKCLRSSTTIRSRLYDIATRWSLKDVLSGTSKGSSTSGQSDHRARSRFRIVLGMRYRERSWPTRNLRFVASWMNSPVTTVACAVAQEIASGSHHCARRRLSSFDVISAAIPRPSITQTGFTRNGRRLLAIP